MQPKYSIKKLLLYNCKGLETITALDKIEMKTKITLKTIRGKFYSFNYISREATKLNYPLFKLYLYIVQHLYALNVIKLKIDSVDITNILEIKTNEF